MSKLLPGDNFEKYRGLDVDDAFAAMKADGVKRQDAIRGLRFLFGLTLPQALEVTAGGANARREEEERMAEMLTAAFDGDES